MLIIQTQTHQLAPNLRPSMAIRHIATNPPSHLTKRISFLTLTRVSEPSQKPGLRWPDVSPVRCDGVLPKRLMRAATRASTFVGSGHKHWLADSNHSVKPSRNDHRELKHGCWKLTRFLTSHKICYVSLGRYFPARGLFFSKAAFAAVSCGFTARWSQLPGWPYRRGFPTWRIRGPAGRDSEEQSKC
jgi:hypothetical protein